MTGVELAAAICTPIGALVGGVATHLYGKRQNGGDGPLIQAMRAELQVFGAQLAKDVENSVTVALLEAELRRREGERRS